MKHARDDYNRIQDPCDIIPHDEPVFLLRGQDKFAAMLVETYANFVEMDGGDPEIVRLSREQADRMRAWPTHKSPDMP